MLSRREAINKIFDSHPDAVFITNTGYISRAVYSEYPNNKNIFYMQGSMGLAPCIEWRCFTADAFRNNTHYSRSDVK